MMAKKSRRERRVKAKTERKEHVQVQREHYQKRKRNKRIFNYTILGLLVIAVIVAFYSASDKDEPGQHDDFARCLTQTGVQMYGTDWCPHCQDQKRLFGPSFKYVTYINCDLNREACDLAGVQGYPTWAFPDGSSVSGAQQLDILAARSGCIDAA